MQYFVFLLVYPILWGISILPFRLLYLVSDVVYILVYYIVGYRKRTVRRNLAMVFPQKSGQERLVIEKKSYRHLCDMFLEMIKTMTISDTEMRKRFSFSNLDVYLDLEKKNKSIALMCAHYASYEWVISMNQVINFKGFVIYKRIANPYFDKLVRDIRSKFKATLITTKESIFVIRDNQRKHILGVYGFASDQSPKAAKAFHWTKFMTAHDTPAHTGAEMLAKQFDMNVIFLKVRKLKRGYYEGSFEVISDNVIKIPDYQITDKFLQLVENQIRQAPEFYLWTHKRWKHRGET